ncbi:MAG: hypothetical protein ACWGQW_02550 [bacterium]
MPRKTADEAEEVMARANEYTDNGTRYHGMTYEEGVVDGILWALGVEETGTDEPEDWPFTS